MSNKHEGSSAESRDRHQPALHQAVLAMQRSIAGQAKSRQAACSAGSARGDAAEASGARVIAGLRSELAALQIALARAQKVNAILRRFEHDGHAVQVSGLLALDWLTYESASVIARENAAGAGGSAFSNHAFDSDRMREIELQIKELEAIQDRTDRQEKGQGYTYREDSQENRVMFFFDAKPDERTRKLLRENGFRWSPDREGQPWARYLTHEGIFHGDAVRKALDAAAAQDVRIAST